MSLTDLAYLLQEYGPVAPTTAVEPIGYPQVRFTDGLMLDEATSRLDHPVSTAGDPITLACWVRRGHADGDTAYALRCVGGSGSIAVLHVGASMRALKNASAADVTATVGSTAVGELLFMAAVYDGETLTGYLSRDSGALQSASTATMTDPGTMTSVQVGHLDGGSQAKGGIEQALVYSAALTVEDITLLVQGGPRGFTDPRLVYASAVQATRGTLDALTTAGAGRFRAVQQFVASLDANLPPLTAPGSRRLSVPAGTGLAVDDPVRFGDRAFTVTSVSTFAGQFDEAIVSPFTSPWFPESDGSTWELSPVDPDPEPDPDAGLYDAGLYDTALYG